MPTLLASPAAAKPIRLEIKRATYEATPIDPGFAGVAAVRLTKLTNHETYDVVLTRDGRAECDCPSYEFTYRGTAGTCKHGQALLSQGLLLAPVCGGSPVAVEPPAAAPAAEVRPITRADLARASFFKLRLPADAPRAVEPAPARPDASIFSNASKVTATVAEAAPEIPASNPRDSWDAWTDQYRVTVADPAVELPPLPSEDRASDIDLSDFAGFDEAPAPPRRARFEPAGDDAERSGYELGFDHELSAVPPSAWPESLKLRWWNGRNRGYLARVRDDSEYDRMHAERLEEAFGDPADRVHESERCGVC